FVAGKNFLKVYKEARSDSPVTKVPVKPGSKLHETETVLRTLRPTILTSKKDILEFSARCLPFQSFIHMSELYGAKSRVLRPKQEVMIQFLQPLVGDAVVKIEDQACLIRLSDFLNYSGDHIVQEYPTTESWIRIDKKRSN